MDIPGKTKRDTLVLNFNYFGGVVVYTLSIFGVSI